MTERESLVSQILAHEGLRLKVYKDSLGVETIGCGRNLRDKGISKAEALMLLDNDLDEVVADLASFPWFARLDAIRQRVLVDLRFNLGPSRFRGFKKMLAAVEQGDYVTASEQMVKSKWARQVKTRAQTLSRMMATGLAFLLLLCAVPAFAQHPNRIEVVMLARQDLINRGIDVDSDDCAGFKIIVLAAWRMRGEGAGLLQKSSGAKCDLNGDSFAHDIIAYPDGTTIDAIGSGPQGPNTPSWGPNCCAADRWRPAVDPAFDSTPAPTPVPVPPSTDVSEHLTKIDQDLSALVDLLGGLDAKLSAIQAQQATDRADVLTLVEKLSQTVDDQKPNKTADIIKLILAIAAGIGGTVAGTK